MYACLQRENGKAIFILIPDRFHSGNDEWKRGTKGSISKSSAY